MQLQSLPASFASSGDEEKDAATQHSLRSVLLKVSSDLTSLSATFSKEINKLKKVIDNALGITATSSSATSTTSYVSVSTSNLPSAKLGVGKTTSSVPFSKAGSLQIPAALSSSGSSNSMVPSKAIRISTNSKKVTFTGVPTVSLTPSTVLSSRAVPKSPVSTSACKSSATQNTSEAKTSATASTTPLTALHSPTEAIPKASMSASAYGSSATKYTSTTKIRAPPTYAATQNHPSEKSTKVASSCMSNVSLCPNPTLTSLPGSLPYDGVKVSTTRASATTSQQANIQIHTSLLGSAKVDGNLSRGTKVDLASRKVSVPTGSSGFSTLLPKLTLAAISPLVSVSPSPIKVTPQQTVTPTEPILSPLIAPRASTSAIISAAPVSPSQIRVTPQHRVTSTGHMVSPLNAPGPSTSVVASTAPEHFGMVSTPPGGIVRHPAFTLGESFSTVQSTTCAVTVPHATLISTQPRESLSREGSISSFSDSTPTTTVALSIPLINMEGINVTFVRIFFFSCILKLIHSLLSN